MSFFNDLNDKMQNLMVGRNGSDRLGRWALGGAIIFLIINMIMPNVICSMLSFALLFYSIYRMFSTNIAARSIENDKFEELIAKLPFVKVESGHGKSSHASDEDSSEYAHDVGNSTSRARAGKSQSDSKTKFNCEQCGQSLSVPKGRGKLIVTCPKCHHQMKFES